MEEKICPERIEAQKKTPGEQKSMNCCRWQISARGNVVVKATTGFAVCRLILKLLLFYSCLDFTQNLGKTHGNALKDYQGNIPLVGINYDKATKKTRVSHRENSKVAVSHLTRCFSLESFNKIFRHFQGKPSPPLTRKTVNA